MARSCSSLNAGIPPIEKKDFTCSGARFDRKLAHLCLETRYHVLLKMLNTVFSTGKFDPVDPRISSIYKDLHAAACAFSPKPEYEIFWQNGRHWRSIIPVHTPVVLPIAVSAGILFRAQSLVTARESEHATDLMKSRQPPERYFV